jgi:hypothetical protein
MLLHSRLYFRRKGPRCGDLVARKKEPSLLKAIKYYVIMRSLSGVMETSRYEEKILGETKNNGIIN